MWIFKFANAIYFYEDHKDNILAIIVKSISV